MKFIKLNIDADLTIVTLHEAIKRICFEADAEVCFEDYCLIVGQGYVQSDILEVQFGLTNRLCIPFEISKIISTDAWILVNNKLQIALYSSGA